MGLRKAIGEMYPWADWTWNPLGGRCPHDCSYCYMKHPPACWSDKYKGPQRVWEGEMKVNLSGLSLTRREQLPFVGDRALVFVCAGNDLGVAPRDMQRRILRKCWEGPENFYLLQSKNPARFLAAKDDFPPNVILGTTVETNRPRLCRLTSRAPGPRARLDGLNAITTPLKMVSVEPIMDCDPEVLAAMIREVDPCFVSIGADSKRSLLFEPSADKVRDLIRRLERFTLVMKKGNLGRLL